MSRNCQIFLHRLLLYLCTLCPCLYLRIYLKFKSKKLARFPHSPHLIFYGIPVVLSQPPELSPFLSAYSRLYKTIIMMFVEKLDQSPPKVQTPMVLKSNLFSGTMTTISDVITQQFVERKKTLDFRRIAIMGSCGFFYFVSRPI